MLAAVQVACICSRHLVLIGVGIGPHLSGYVQFKPDWMDGDPNVWLTSALS